MTKIVLDLKEEGNVTILDSISKDWNVFTATETKIEMKRTSDDESIDFLTFEKN